MTEQISLTHSEFETVGHQTSNKEKKSQILWYGKGANGLEEVEQVLLCADDAVIKERETWFHWRQSETAKKKQMLYKIMLLIRLPVATLRFLN